MRTHSVAPTWNAVCVHLPTSANRFCDDCGALVIAHELRFDRWGHAHQLPPGSPPLGRRWCVQCDDIVAYGP